MTIVRALDVNHDWIFGKGINDYRSGNAEIAQSIDTRLESFLNDCFFDLGAGLDWFNLLGGKNTLAINLAASASILNTTGVVALLALSSVLDPLTRRLTLRYQVQTTYSVYSSIFTLNINPG